MSWQRPSITWCKSANGLRMNFGACAINSKCAWLANMLDGLLAVEGGQQTKTGELYNEIPDRIADVAFRLPAFGSILSAMRLRCSSCIFQVEKVRMGNSFTFWFASPK